MRHQRRRPCRTDEKHDPGAYIGHEPEFEAETIPGGIGAKDERVAAVDTQSTGVGAAERRETEPDARQKAIAREPRVGRRHPSGRGRPAEERSPQSPTRPQPAGRFSEHSQRAVTAARLRCPGMSLESELRLTSDSLMRALDHLHDLEEEKRTLPAGSPRFVELARQIEDMALEVLRRTETEASLAEDTEARREAGGGVGRSINATPAEPRELALVLNEWREAERRLAASPAASPEFGGRGVRRPAGSVRSTAWARRRGAALLRMAPPGATPQSRIGASRITAAEGTSRNCGSRLSARRRDRRRGAGHDVAAGEPRVPRARPSLRSGRQWTDGCCPGRAPSD